MPPYLWGGALLLQDRCGLFADGRYSELSLWSGERRIHRLVVTPRWYRFPFMAPGDLQLGALLTDPAWRRQGLARLAMAVAHRLFAGPSQRLWYVTDEANVASLALARLLLLKRQWREVSLQSRLLLPLSLMSGHVTQFDK